MIPREQHQPWTQNANSDGFTSIPEKNKASKEKKLGIDLLSSLKEHATATQELSGKQLFTWLSVIEGDCQQVHDFCQKILNGSLSMEGNSLAEMSSPLSHMVAQIENGVKLNPSQAASEVLNHLKLEINQIKETIQLKTYLNLKEKLQADIDAWHEELTSIQNGDIIDFSSKKHIAIIEKSFELIVVYNQLVKQGVPPALRKQLVYQISEKLKIVAKVQKDITSKINDYFAKYLQCAKSQLENEGEEPDSKDFQESLATFEYFNTGLGEAIEKMSSTSVWLKMELSPGKESPFTKVLKDILATLLEDQAALEQILVNAAVKPSLTASFNPETGIDVAKAWDTLQIGHTFRFQYP
nr:hypothetical protein [Parachlamydiaceae bacterium]